MMMGGLDSYELNRRWTAGKLRKDDLKEWTKEQLKSYEVELNEEDFDHLLDCLYAIYEWYYEGRSMGHFLTAVVTNDLEMSVGRADKTNIKCLPLYVRFLYNIAPGDYKAKAKKLTGG